jgi:DNA-binding MarR family transcriptional regulator
MPKASARARFNFLVHDVSRMRRTLFDQALKPFGITRAQWWALGNISRYSETGVVQTDLAQLLDTGKVSAGNLIDRLEDANLVRRVPDATDRRIKRVLITDQGFAMLDRIALVGAELDSMLFAGVDDSELVAAGHLLELVKGNIKRALSGPLSLSVGDAQATNMMSAPRRSRPDTIEEDALR